MERPNCPNCGARTLHCGDTDYCTITENPNYKNWVYSQFSCPECGANIDIIYPQNYKKDE